MLARLVQGRGNLVSKQSHSPRAYEIDNPDKHFDTVSYTGDSVAFYTHTGTHVDTFNHYGYHRRIWNNFSADEDLVVSGRCAGRTSTLR